MKPRIYKKDGFWFCQTYGDHFAMGCGKTPSVAYSYWSGSMFKKIAKAIMGE